VDRFSGAWVQLAKTKSAVGVILPPNRVIYKDFLDGVEADYLITYQASGIEVDVILREAPPTPSHFDMDDASTYLEMSTLFEETPEPLQHATPVIKEADATKRLLMKEPDLNDHTLRFGSAQMPLGIAYRLTAIGMQTTDASEIAPVAKLWEELNGAYLLRERVNYSSITRSLDSLPKRLHQNLASSSIAPRSWDLGIPPEPPQSPLQFATSDAREGFVLDYVLLSSATTSQTFSQATYLITSTFRIDGTCTFQPGAILKFADDAELRVYYGPVSGSGAILTSRNDLSVGEKATSDGNLPANRSKGLFLYYLNQGTSSLSNLDIRYANTAVDIVGHSLTCNLTNFAIRGAINGVRNANAGSTNNAINVISPCYWNTTNKTTGSPTLTLVNDSVCGNTAPGISSITNIVINEDTGTGPLAFRIHDLETPASELWLAAYSSNPTLIDPVSSSFDGSSSHRTITLFPKANQSGTAVISLIVGDYIDETFTTFTVTVNAVNDPPAVVGEPDFDLTADQMRTIAVDFVDHDSEVSDMSIIFLGYDSSRLEPPQASGSGSVRQITLTPKLGMSGDAWVQFQFTDSQGASASSYRTLRISPTSRSGGGGSGSASGGAEVPFLGPCEVPDLSAFEGTYYLPSTYPDNIPGNSKGDPVYLNPPVEHHVGGNPGCVYTIEATIEAKVRVLPEFYNTQGLDIYTAGDTIQFGTLGVNNAKHNRYTSEQISENQMEKIEFVGIVNHRGGCEGSKLGLTYRAQGGHGEVWGLNGAYVKVKKVRVIGAKYTGGEVSCEGDCSFGDYLGASPSSASVLWQGGVGRFGKGDVHLGFYDAHLSTNSAHASRLGLSGPTEGVELVYARDNVLRQVLVPNGLIDIHSNVVSGCEVRFYTNGSLLSPVVRGANGLFQIKAGALPHRVQHICNPSPTNINCLQVVQATGTQGPTNQFDFWAGALSGYSSNHWRLTRGAAAGVQTRTYLTNSAEKIVVDVISNTASSATVWKQQQKLANFPFGEALVENIVDPGGSNLVSTFSYYTNSLEAGYGKLRTINNADGTWQRMFYDSAGRLLQVFSPIGTAAPTTNSSLCRLVQYNYSTNIVGDDIGTYDPNRPRSVVQYDYGYEVSRSYYQYKRGEYVEIRCVTPGAAWNNSSNLLTRTKYFVEGPFQGEIESIRYPDATFARWSYLIDSDTLTTTVWRGATAPNGTNVVDGTMTITVVGSVGEMLSSMTYDVSSNGLIERIMYSNHDPQMRPQKVEYLDGSTDWTLYDCCGASSSTNRDGVITSYEYDNLRRQVASTTGGVRTQYVLDPMGRTTNVVIIGTNGTSRIAKRTVYDKAGRLTEESDANLVKRVESASVNGSGQVVKSTTYAHGTSAAATRTEIHFRDGSLASVTGSATQPVRYEYGVESESGVMRRYAKEIRLDAALVDTPEWKKSYFDHLGRNYKTAFAPDASGYEQTWFNAIGQPVKQRDLDGIVTLYQYNAQGAVELTAVDLNGNGAIDLGSDRVTRRQVDYATGNLGIFVRRERTYEFQTTGNTNGTLRLSVETTPNGLRSWSFSDGATNSVFSGIADANGVRRTTNWNAAGVSVVTTTQRGYEVSRRVRNTAGVEIEGSDFIYDEFGRRSKTIDLRSGATSYAFDDLDRIVSVTAPASGAGDPAQVTSTTYDALGRAVSVTQPDGTVVANEYFLTGLLKKTTGSRAYPVEYTYDAQGRMKTMKTWQAYSGGAGTPTTTTWNYDSNRGWLTSKRFADTNGPVYTYTTGGRLKTRTWARSHVWGSPIVTTYTYGFDDSQTTNQHADLVEINYNDGITPGSTNIYDRLGRPTTLIFGTNTLTRTYTSTGGLDAEAYTSGTMSGLKTVYTYDGALRRLTVTPQNGTTVLGSARTYGYDSASRLGFVSDGNYSGTYAYLANSSLWGTLTFKQGASTVRATTSREFDLLNRLRLVSTTPAAGGSGWGPQYAYNSANQRTRRTDIDGSYWVYEYDSLGQVISGKRFWADGSPVAGQQYEYAYDDIGNRISSKEGGDNSGQALRSSAYSRNSLNQYTARTNASFVDILGLANASAAVSVNGVAASRRGEYFRRELAITNAAGPVATTTTVAALSGGSSSNLVGTLLSPPANQVLTYDADGNLLSDGLWDYTWDGENRLLSVQSATTLAAAQRRRVSWQYDAAGRRIRQTTAGWNGSNSTWTNANDLKLLYDGWACIAELNATNNALITSYAWGLDLSGTPTGAGGVGGLLWIRPNGGAAHFAVYDGNGNVIGLVDGSTGLESARYEYDTFGNTIRLTGTGTIARDNKFRFSTKRTEPESNLILYEYRPYSSTLGRWPNRDPIGEKGGLNIHGFARNDPIQGFDPLGLWSPGAHDALIEHALKDKASTACIARLKQSSRDFDKKTQGVQFTHVHSMRAKDQKPEDAISARDTFIKETLEKAKKAANSGECDEAMDLLGQALHPIMDSTSPMHTDSSGNPKVWNPLWPFGHSPNDSIGNETVKDITPEIYKKMDEEIRKAFEKIKCNCCQ
jgi:RHS repeat-associated protein